MFYKCKDINFIYLFAIGLLYRLLVFIGFYTHITMYPDSEGYIELSNLITSFELEGYNGQRSLGYPLLISLAFGNLYVLVFYQFILGSITTLFWYKILLNLHFSKKTSVILSLFLMSFIHVFFYETAVLVEALTLFIISIVVVILTSDYFKQSALKREILLGILLGILVLIKPFYAYLPFLIYGVYIYKNFNFKNIFSPRLLIFMLPIMVYFGWSYVNKLNTGHFVSTTFFGLNVAQNCVYFAEKGPDNYNWISDPYVEYRDLSIKENKDVAMAIWYAYDNGAYDKFNLDFAEFSKELGTFAKLTIQSNPLDYLEQVVMRSWVDFWKTSIYWNTNNFNSEGANKVFLFIWLIQKTILVFLKLIFVMISPFLVVYWIGTKKNSMAGFLALFVLVPSVLQALITYGTNSRFSFPFEFLMIMVVTLIIKNNYGFCKRRFQTLITNKSIF